MDDFLNKFETERADIDQQMGDIMNEINQRADQLDAERIEHMLATLSGLISRLHELSKLAVYDDQLVNVNQGDQVRFGEHRSRSVDATTKLCESAMQTLSQLKQEE